MALALQMLGDGVMRPFLQDTIQFWPLSAAMTGTLFVAPLTIMRVLFQVGPFPGRQEMHARVNQMSECIHRACSRSEKKLGFFHRGHCRRSLMQDFIERQVTITYIRQTRVHALCDVPWGLRRWDHSWC